MIPVVLGWLLLSLLGLVALHGLARTWAAAPKLRRAAARRAAGRVALVYVGMMLLLAWLENGLLFYPTPQDVAWDPPADPAIRDVWLQKPDAPWLHAWYCPVPQPRWYVVFSHGNAGNLSHRQYAIRQFQQLGAAVLIYDYPGYGHSAGKPNEANCLAAGHAAHAWLLDQEHAPPEKILLFGESLGGGVATELALTRPHRALILASTFTSVPDVAQQLFPWLPARWLVRNRFANLDRLRRYQGPVFLSHGTADRLIPFAHAERLYAAAAGGPKVLFPVPGRGHNDAQTPEMFAALDRFLGTLPPVAEGIRP